MLKKFLITFTFAITLFFSFGIDSNAALIDNDTSHTWELLSGTGVRSTTTLQSDFLYFELNYELLDDFYNYQTGVTNLVGLFNTIRYIDLFLANSNGNPITSDDHYYSFELDFTAPFLELLIYFGTDFNNLSLVDYYSFDIGNLTSSTSIIYPSFMFYFDFVNETFRFNFGNLALQNSINLTYLNEYLTHGHSSYHPTFAVRDITGQLRPAVFNDSEHKLTISDQVTNNFSYYDNAREFNENYNVLTENIDPFPGYLPPTATHPLDIILFNTGFYNVPGFLILYFLVIMLLNLGLWRLGSPSIATLIANIGVTSFFMFFDYLPLYVSILMITFFIIILIAQNKGGLFNE